MSEHWWDDTDTGHRVPKAVYAVVAKGRAPEDKRAKTWVRIHTSKTDAKATKALWEKHKFLDVALIETPAQWEEVAC